MRRWISECVYISEIDCLSGSTGWIDLEYVEQERTPEQIIEIGIQLHLAGLSPSSTKQYLERLDVERSRTAIHNWVQKAGVQPTSDAEPNHIAVDETVIQVNDERPWLYAAADPETTNSSTFGSSQPERRNLPCCSCGNCNSACRSLKQRFWSMMLTISRLRCRGSDSDFGYVAAEIGMPSNVSLKR